jgi:hypothetical protein
MALKSGLTTRLTISAISALVVSIFTPLYVSALVAFGLGYIFYEID